MFFSTQNIYNSGFFLGDWLLLGGIFGQVVAHGLRFCCSALLVLLSFFRTVLLICTCCFLGSFVLFILSLFSRYIPCCSLAILFCCSPALRSSVSSPPPPRTCFKTSEDP